MAIQREIPSFESGDIAVLVTYFVLIIVVGVLSSRGKKNASIQDYFLAGRKVNWILVGTGLFATNISSTHFIGLTGTAARSGIAVAGFELNAMFILVLLGWVFVPVYLASGVYTMPEFLRRRFGSARIQTYLSSLSLLLSLLIRISAGLYAGATFIEQTLDWNLYYSSIAILVVAGLYTVVGGLKAVMWTDFIQSIFVVAGAAAVAVLSFQAVGGYDELVDKFPLSYPSHSAENHTQNTSCGKVPDDYMSLLRSSSDRGYPWTGMVFGVTISGIWGWCSDQVLVQRCLSAKNISHAKGGCLLAAYLKSLPLFLFVFPGMASRILFPDQVACSDPESCRQICGSVYGCGDIAYPLLVLKLMPAGARGFMMSVILAAIMSSLTSVFNSSATLFTMDIWPMIRRNKKPSELELVVVGRTFVTLLAGVSILWVPVIKASQGSQLFNYTQSIISYLAPPVCAVYLLAVMYPRINERGAFWGLMIGSVAGLIRFALDLTYAPTPCGDLHKKNIPEIIAGIHYLHFGCILFLLVLFATIALSFTAPAIDEKHLYRLTFWTRHSSKQRVDLNVAMVCDDCEMTTLPSNLEDPSESIDHASGCVYGTGGMPLEEPSVITSKGLSSRIWSFVCCLERGAQRSSGDVEVFVPTATTDTLEANERLRESKSMKIFLNLNGVVLLAVSIALWIIYK